MSIERIKALKETADQMKNMCDEAISREATNDLLMLQKEAFSKITQYLSDVSASLNGKCVRVELKDYARGSDSLKIIFNNICVFPDASHKEVLDWLITREHISRDKQAFDYYCAINSLTGKDFPWNKIDYKEEYIFRCMVYIIENWKSVKEQINSSVEEAIAKDMKDSQEKMIAFSEKYEKAANFEI